jgi:hypothetical protein
VRLAHGAVVRSTQRRGTNAIRCELRVEHALLDGDAERGRDGTARVPPPIDDGGCNGCRWRVGRHCTSRSESMPRGIMEHCERQVVAAVVVRSRGHRPPTWTTTSRHCSCTRCRIGLLAGGSTGARLLGHAIENYVANPPPVPLGGGRGWRSSAPGTGCAASGEWALWLSGSSAAAGVVVDAGVASAARGTSGGRYAEPARATPIARGCASRRRAQRVKGFDPRLPGGHAAAAADNTIVLTAGWGGRLGSRFVAGPADSW